MEPDALIQMQLESNPPSSAHDYYTFARLAEKLGLYQEALSYLDFVFSLEPSEQLREVAEALDLTLREIIKNEGFLTAFQEANKLIRKRNFQEALDLIDATLALTDVEGTNRTTLEDLKTEVNQEFSDFVVDEWYRQMNVQAKKNVRKSTLQEAMSYARSGFEQDIMDAIIEVTGGSQQDIRARFQQRSIEELKRRHVSFGNDGWYDITGGPLPSSGNIPQNSQRSGDRDGLPDLFDGSKEQFQEKETPSDSELSKEAIREFLKKIQEEREQAEESSKPSRRERPQYDPDDPKLQVPENTPSIQDWWDNTSRTKRRNWLIAYYVLNGGTMIIIDQSYDKLYYK